MAYKGKSYDLDDLGVPLFQETPKSIRGPHVSRHPFFFWDACLNDLLDPVQEATPQVVSWFAVYLNIYVFRL
jgi:hypothetical protein